MINKRLINTGVAAAAFDPLQNFETVTYTGNGGTQKITGYIRKGAAFNGSSSKIVLPSGSPFNDSNTIKAVSMWFRLPTTSSILYGFSVGSDNSGSYFFNLYISGSTIGGQVRDGGSSNQSTMAATWTADTDWHHVVWQLGSTEKEIYLDGNKLSVTFTNTGTANDTSWIDYPSYSGNVVGQIGVNRATASFSYSNGLKDQVRFFNKALSSSEVTTLYGETYASSTKSTTDIFGDGSGVALYELDEDANDTAGVSGKFGSAAIFDGSSSYITLGTGVVPVSSDYSITMWLYRNSGSGRDVLLSQYQSSQDNRISIEVDDTTNKISFNSDDVVLRTSTYTVPFDTWTHLAFTLANATDDFKVYANGVEQTTQIDSGTADYTMLNYTTQLGTYNSLQDSRILDGKIDELRIYSDVLTSDEVGYIYNNTTASIPTDNLENYYKFDGDATDEQGNNDATTVNNISYGFNGTATNVNFLGMAFQPDLVWIRERTNAAYSNVYDSVRGNTLLLSTELTSAEYAQSADAGLESFDSNGFTVDYPNTGNYYNNRSGENYVAWCWKGGGAAVSNTEGTNIASNVSVNNDAGFSIVSYTTPSSPSSSDTVGHGLSAAPELILTKTLSIATDWYCWHKDIGTGKYLVLNSSASTATFSDLFATVTSSAFQYRPSGSQFNYIAYCFHSVDGYQKVGSYTGNTSGVTVTIGFKPRFLMIKRSDSTGNWFIYDTIRSGGDTLDDFLHPNLSASEATNNTTYEINATSTGFNVVGTGDGQTNSSGGTHIYLAIA